MVTFADAPSRLANVVEGDLAMAATLVSSIWDDKNIALTDVSEGISVFKLDEHRMCSTDETERRPCVRFTAAFSAARMASAGLFPSCIAFTAEAKPALAASGETDAAWAASTKGFGGSATARVGEARVGEAPISASAQVAASSAPATSSLWK